MWRWTLQTRYTLRRNTASIMKGTLVLVLILRIDKYS